MRRWSLFKAGRKGFTLYSGDDQERRSGAESGSKVGGEQTKLADSALLFKGNATLMTLIARLYPRQGRAPQRNRPLVCLVRDEAAREILPAVHERIRSGLAAAVDQQGLDAASPPPTHELPPATAEDVEQVRALLGLLAEKLGRARDRSQRIRRFRRFALVAWLMEQNPSSDDFDPEARDRVMRDLLRSRERYQIPDIPNDLGVPAWLRAVAIPLTALLYRARISGRVPLLSGHYRWFVRRDSLAPRLAGAMPSVAAELTAVAWRDQPNTTLLFLVNSFMEDIRAAYRGPVKRFVGVRRTTCCLLLISNITRRNGGYQLLRAINEVRNLTRLSDPLLVLTESQRQPPFADPPDSLPSVTRAQVEFDAWTENIVHEQKTKQPVAWFLSMRVPTVPENPEELRDLRADLVATEKNNPIVAPREPHYRKAARLVSIAVVFAAVVLGYGRWSHAHCGNGLSWPGLRPTVSWVANECIGVSDDPTVLFSPLDEPTRQLAHQVKGLNDEVQARHGEQASRPVVTLVYLGALSTPTQNTGSVAAEVEGMRGVAVAQRRQLDANGSGDPLIRMIFANGGQRMGEGTSVAATIGAAARDDPTLVGVVGLNESYKATEDTINALADRGIPTIAATLSADSLADNLLMYFQIAPQNRREAAVAAAYAAQRAAPGDPSTRSVRIYLSDDPADIYSTNLADDTLTAFRGQGFEVTTVTFTPDGNTPAATPPRADLHLSDAGKAGADSCNRPGLVFYAARPLPDFGSFLAAARNCPTSPHILADDDITRYVANDRARRQYPSIPFDYLAFSATNPAQTQVGPEQDFYRSYARMFPTRPGSGASLDGHAALAYDAVQTFAASVQRLRTNGQKVPISPGTVWRQITAITNPGLRGASGYIDFGGRIDRHVPLDKPVLILTVTNGEVAPTTLYCGPPPKKDPRTQPWCPPGE